MKIARVEHQGEARLAVITGEAAVLLPESVAGRGPSFEPEAWRKAVNQIEAYLATRPGPVPLSSLTFLAPVERPGKIMAIGLNYADHIAESGMAAPERQVWFAKLPNSVNAPFAPIEIPRASQEVDYEVELVAVIGKGGRHISTEKAPDHVFGYCVGNDVSVRDWQRHTPQWILGKSFDTHCPFGPWITTADEIGDPHGLDITCLVNGEVRQSSNTRHLVFNLWQQIALLSEALTLEPGDLIFTGTPGGVGLAMNPPSFLKVGDVVRCEIEKLGAIEASFVPEA